MTGAPGTATTAGMPYCCARHTHPLATVLMHACACAQVNTSGEESKYGVEPSACTALARHIWDACKHLRLAGLMTIGQPDYTSRPENFQVWWSAGGRSMSLPLSEHLMLWHGQEHLFLLLRCIRYLSSPSLASPQQLEHAYL